jgi:YD repeat-containing protein
VTDFTASGEPIPSSTVVVVLSRTRYNDIGKVDTTEDENGIVTMYEYDELGNVVETRTYAVYDEEIPANNVLLTTSQTLYDKEGRALVAVGPYAAGENPVGTETVYDEQGRVVATRRWKNVTTHLEYFKIDETGDKVFEGDPAYSGISSAPVGKSVPDNRVVCNAWDGSGTDPANYAWLSEAATPNETDKYGPANPAGRLLSFDRTKYDIAGRVERSYTLGEQGQEISTNEYKYDVAGRQTKVITLPDIADRAETITEYDGQQRQSVTDALSDTTSFMYDALGRVTRTTHPATKFDGSTEDRPLYTHTVYDGLGRNRYDIPQTGLATLPAAGTADFDALKAKEFVYDTVGRLTMVILPKVEKDPPGDTTLVHPIYRYYYDSYGNQTCILDAKGRATVFEYDHMQRAVKKYMPYQVTFAAPAPDLCDPAVHPDLATTILPDLPGGQPCEEFQYDDLGRQVVHVDYAGHWTRYRYYNADAEDEDYFMAGGQFGGQPGQLKSQDSYVSEPDPTPGTPAEQRVFTHDALGRKQTETVYEAGVQTHSTTYAYDDEGRVISITSPEGIINYDYNPTTTTPLPAGRRPLGRTPIRLLP